MGAWGLNILDNDTANGVYQEFMEMYAIDISVEEINKTLLLDNESLLSDRYEHNNFWFALAFAQWETKSLNENVYVKVKQIVDSKNDIKLWGELEASTSDLKEREKILQKFLEKISIEKQRAKSKKTIKILPIFKKGDCLTFKLKCGNYGGAIVLEADAESEKNYDGFGYNLVATTRINQIDFPTLNDFQNAELLIISYDEKTVEKARKQITWLQPDRYKRYYGGIFTKVGAIDINKKYKYLDRDFSGSAGWHLIKDKADLQFEFEMVSNKISKQSTPLKSLIY